MKYIIYIVISLIVLVGIGFGISKIPQKPGTNDDFATCIKDSGAIFYGAFWCSHCQDQKTLFGKSAKLLPYKECSTPDSKGQTKVCTDAGIKSYPTWDFPGKERQLGTLSFEKLSEFTGCKLPEVVTEK